jgi:dihydroorotate dehydrogenase
MRDAYKLIFPALTLFEPETAHRLAVFGLKRGIAGALFADRNDDHILAVNLWSRQFPNPIGLAAGFDKDAEVFAQALALGFGFVEVGGVTPLPQPGNPRPRLFRLESDRAVINRFGFNSAGAEVVAARLKGRGPGLVGLNLAKNKTSDDAAADFAATTRMVAGNVDFLVINVSSPNTPGLRALQSIEPLVKIIRSVRNARNEAGAQPPLLLKIAPDLAVADVNDVCRVAEAEQLDGLVVSNTTITRPGSLSSPLAIEGGGLSGAPLFELSTRVLREVYALTGGRIPLIGVGGVGSGADAYAKIRAGASLVQLYSALVYEGPGLIGRIKRELTDLLRRDGFSTVADAVGADVKRGTGR